MSSLRFGTSGLRGLVSELNGLPAYAYVRAFLDVLSSRGEVAQGAAIFLGRDLRASSPDIMNLCAAAIEDSNFVPVDCGALPTPALAYHAMQRSVPAIMVTGSHVPDDRNGLKFYRASGEIDKADEAQISAAHARLWGEMVARPLDGGQADDAALERFAQRYCDILPSDALEGLRVGLYQHSSVARDFLEKLLSRLGAEIVPLGRSDRFVPVDTEALRAEDIELLKRWAREHRLDAIVSTDGDADRPLIADEAGRFVRGDLVGALTAAWLDADWIIVPVTANSVLETCGRFGRVMRTRVGSPYVIEGMTHARDKGASRIVGFESNGGVLLGSPITMNGAVLEALPTRDSVLPILACLYMRVKRGEPLSRIAAAFGFRVALSDRLENVSSKRSASFLSRLRGEGMRSAFGRIATIDQTDGVRLFFEAGVVHYRASGNAPELRCYVEAESEDEAKKLLERGLAFARQETGVVENQ